MSHLKKFRAALAEKGADAAIIGSKLNQKYLSDFDFDDGFVLVTKGQSYLITDFRYVEAATEQRNPELEVLMPNIGMLTCMEELLRENGCRKVMIEEKTLSFADYGKYSEKLTGMELCSGASALLEELRLYKDEKELETMARAQAVTDAAFAHILNFIKPEMTEIEVALELEFFMRRNGADGLAFDTIAISGTTSSRPHGVPGRRQLEKGFLTMDFGARVNGYCSDMTRTIVVGRADAEMKKLYNTVLRAQTEALAAYCEGASCAALDKIARDIIDGVPEYRGTFKDVAQSAWYAPYVDTAAAYGIVNGVGDGKFHPDGAITVQEAAAMTARAASLCGMDPVVEHPDTVLRAYTDASRVSSWAKPSMAYCAASGLWAQGASALTPTRQITRGEIAQMLCGLLLGAHLLQ